MAKIIYDNETTFDALKDKTIAIMATEARVTLTPATSMSQGLMLLLGSEKAVQAGQKPRMTA